MNVVDSSAWVEYFVDGSNAGRFAPAIEDSGALIVPAIALYEVFKWGLRERGEQAALRLAGPLGRGGGGASQSASSRRIDLPIALC